MKKDEFLERLVYLLQDIPDGDREEAIQYYRDYLEEAGSENEEQTIEEFGSPERVAAMIRADLAGNLSEGGSFTEKGYEDERFRDPNYGIARRLDLPEASVQDGKKGTDDSQGSTHGTGYGNYSGAEGRAGYREGASGGTYQNAAGQNGYGRDAGYRYHACQDDGYRDASYGGGMYQGGEYRDAGYHDSECRSPYEDRGTADTAYTGREKKPWSSRILKWILWFILLCVAAPVILGIGGTASGLLVGVFSIILGIFAVIAVMTIGMIVAGVITGSMGFTLIGVNFFDFLLLMGLSMVSFGLGILGIILSWLLLGGLVPFLWKSIVKLVRSLAGRRKGGKGNE